VEASTEVAPVPDLLGNEGRAQLLAARILELQRERFQLEATRVVNEHEVGDPVPGLSPPVTYGAHSQKLRAGEQRLLDASPELYDSVVKLATRRSE
jgi:hypothetical protein